MKTGTLPITIVAVTAIAKTSHGHFYLCIIGPLVMMEKLKEGNISKYVSEEISK
ncbi:MAG: hypothetical protein QXE10_07435 [Desulfurococcaceae archaeon]